MGIDVGSAYSRKAELYACASQLRGAKTRLEQYKQIISGNWQAQEVSYYMQAIEKVKKEMDSAISEMESIGDDIVTVAQIIKKEEEEAAKKAKEEAEKKKKASKGS